MEKAIRRAGLDHILDAINDLDLLPAGLQVAKMRTNAQMRPDAYMIRAQGGRRYK
jgi:hypothetical protein